VRIERLDDPEAVVEIDLSPDRALTAQNREMLVYYHDAALLVLAQADEKQGDRDKAHEALWQATDYLASKAPSPTETNEMVLFWYKRARYENLRTQAEMAEREGRKLDALNGYRETLSVLALGQQKELMARQRKLWQELGGSDEGWQQWMDQALAATPKTARTRVRDRPEYSAENRKLPPLLAQDTEGRQWTLDRLAGKTTIAVVWATWCVPCRAELPYFAKLADRLKNSDLALAISFNTDDNIALAESFAKSHGYTFPVLGAKQYAEDLMPLMSIPRTWISRNGVIAEEHIGFGDDGDKWVEQLLSQLKEP
jgi:thiol-disulfide isomerase/thioredoxin